MIKFVYPNIDVQAIVVDGNYFIRISTFVRKQHTDGKWYLNFVLENLNYGDINGLINTIKLFNEEVYKYQHLGIVIPNLQSIYGGNLCELDTDQRDEEERLKTLIL